MVILQIYVGLLGFIPMPYELSIGYAIIIAVSYLRVSVQVQTSSPRALQDSWKLSA